MFLHLDQPYFDIARFTHLSQQGPQSSTISFSSTHNGIQPCIPAQVPTEFGSHPDLNWNWACHGVGMPLQKAISTISRGTGAIYRPESHARGCISVFPMTLIVHRPPCGQSPQLLQATIRSWRNIGLALEGMKMRLERVECSVRSSRGLCPFLEPIKMKAMGWIMPYLLWNSSSCTVPRLDRFIFSTSKGYIPCRCREWSRLKPLWRHRSRYNKSAIGV